MATASLAAWATSLTFALMPLSVQRASRRSFYNYIGCAIYGSLHPAATKARDVLKPFFGHDTCSLLGYRGSMLADAQHAALLNGIASHAHDYDDTHLETIIHPTGPVASALLAYVEHAQQPVDGQQFLTALVAGIEAECKLGLAVWPEHYDIGWHITSTCGSIGAAVAIGKIMKLDEKSLQHAIGLAAVQVTGMREVFGSDAKSFHVGRAAEAGLLAALLAQGGYTSSLQALEAERGWANVVAGGGTPQLHRYLDQLGTVWEIEKNAFKPFPCGIVCHPVIDACIQAHHVLRGKAGARELFNVLECYTVEATVHPLVIELTSKRSPRNGLEAKFSVFHGGAVGLLYGAAAPVQYEDEIVMNPAVVTVRDRMNIRSSNDIQADEAIVTFTSSAAETFTIHVQHAVGSLATPMTDDQLKRKFIDQVTTAYGADRARRTSDICWNILDEHDVSELVRQV